MPNRNLSRIQIPLLSIFLTIVLLNSEDAPGAPLCSHTLVPVTKAHQAWFRKIKIGAKMGEHPVALLNAEAGAAPILVKISVSEDRPYAYWSENGQSKTAWISYEDILPNKEINPDAKFKTINSWEHFQAQVSSNLIAITKKVMTNVYYQKAVERKELHIQFLEKIGIDFRSPDKSSFTLKKFGEYYEGKIQESISTGRVKPDEVLYPARVFKDFEGHFVFVKLWDPPPSTKLIPQDDFITNDVQLLMQKEGFFVVGDGAGPSVGPWRFFDHDLGHVSGLLDNVEYMVATRNLAKKRSFTRQELEKNSDALKGQSQSPDRKAFQERYYYSTEFISYIPQKWRPLLNETLVLPKDFTLESGTPSYAVLKDEIERRAKPDPDFLGKYLKALVELNDQAAETVGGGSRDVYNSIRHAEQIWSDFKLISTGTGYFSLQWLIEASRYVNSGEADLNTKESYAKMVRLAVLTTQLMVLSNRYTPKQWMEATAKMGQDLAEDPLAQEIVSSKALGFVRSFDWQPQQTSRAQVLFSQAEKLYYFVFGIFFPN